MSVGHRTGIKKADVSSIGSSSERIEKLWVVCGLLEQAAVREE